MATWSNTIVVPRKNVSVSFVPYTSASSYSWFNAESSLTGSAFACRFDAGDGKYSKISVNFSSRYYAQEVVAYLYDSYTNLPRAEADIPTSSYVGMARITDIHAPSGEITISFENVNKKFYPYAYVILKPTSNSQKEFSFYDVAVETVLDDTPPICYFNTPDSPGEEFPNYDYIPLYIKAVWPESGMRPNQYEVQCSYEENNWENPILTMQTDSFFIQPNTLEAGTVYCRGRAKTSYSEWGSWSYTNFTAVERKAYINNIGFKQGFLRYQDRTKPITVTWFQVTEGITVTHSVIQYALKEDYNNWIDLGTVEGDTREFTIPANTFPAVAAEGSGAPYGGIKLKIVSYNANGIASEGNDTTWFLTVDDVFRTSPYLPRNGAAFKETEPITFTFDVTSVVTQTPPTDVDFRWKIPNGEWQYLNHLVDSMIAGSGYHGLTVRNTVVIPANTFPGAVIYYQIRAYNQDGVASDWSSEAYFTTIDAPSVSKPISPSGTMEDTDSGLLFRWSTSSTSGSAPTGADLRYSYDGTAWLELGHTDGTTQLAVSGGIIHAGTVQWQVRSYNRNGTPGAWSAPATFVARAAPRILEVTADGKPFSVITWQATDQQCYKIEIDESILYGPFFGEEKMFRLPDYLDDGVHTVKVHVQNEMNIWSKPGELNFTVLNVPGGALYLSGDFDLDAELFWEDETDGSDYLVFRDGTLIGESAHKRFNDRVVLGEHSYYVVKRFADGYFSRSNEVECTLSTGMTQVALLAGGEWMPLEKSENAKQTQRFTRSRSVSYHHFSGDKNPTPEIGDEETLVAEYDAAWFYTEEGSKKLRDLLGQALIIKSRGDEVVIGVLEAYTKVNRKHFRGYAFSIHQMEWKDYVCAE